MRIKIVLRLITTGLLLSVFALNIDTVSALGKKKPSSRIERIKTKRVKHKSSVFGGFSRGGYSNPLFRERSGSGNESGGCQELSTISYNELSETSCNVSNAVSIALARATEVCQSRGCRRAINVSIREQNTSVPILGGNGRRYEYICGIVGNCTNRLF